MSPLKLRPTNQALDRDEAWRDVRHERSRGYICHPYWLIGSRNLGAKRPYLALCLGPATALSLSTNLVTKSGWTNQVPAGDHNRFSVNGGGRKLDRDPEAARAARWPWAAAQRVLTPTLSLTDQLRPDRAVRSTLIFVLTCTAALTR
jgi:hypothetical protein